MENKVPATGWWIRSYEQYLPGATLEEIYALYEFDRKLRIITLEYTLEIEKAAKSPKNTLDKFLFFFTIKSLLRESKTAYNIVKIP